MVRQPILRPGLPLTSCVFTGDNLKTTIHLGIHVNNELIGVCSLVKSKNTLITEKQQYQLRGMAILKVHQNKGFGKLLLNYSEVLLKKLNVKLIWCNARETAITFYNKAGYQVKGTPFIIKNIGLHFMMCKTI